MPGRGYARSVPPQNQERRRALADAAIEILGHGGVHALSHRAVDEKTGLPPGTTSNYFRSREALLTAVVERVAEAHHAEMAAADGMVKGPIDREGLIGLIGGSLMMSATTNRVRYLAVYELTLEAARRPQLQRAFDDLAAVSLEFTLAQHRQLGLDTTTEQVHLLIALFGGALFTLVVAPAEQCHPDAVAALARAIVTGVLGP